jgi:glycosyltransferase involved in cell wall biosynthesis
MTSSEDTARRLKICLVGPAWPFRGGISHYNTSLARELALRHDVSVVNFSRLYPGFLFPGKTQYDESGSTHRVESERLIDSINPFTWIRAGFRIARSRPDMTVVQWWHPYFAPALVNICVILRMFSSTKIVFICHNVVPHETSPIDRILSSMAFLAPHAFVVQSQEDRINLLRIRKKASVTSHPLPIFDFFRSGEMTVEEARNEIGEGEGPLLLFFGLIRPYKGLRHLIEAMPSIAGRTGARLLVVGEFYEDSAPYFELAGKLGVSDRIRFVDRYIANEEVAAFFTAADLVMLPYISATQSAIAQVAVAFDRPMIATRVGGLPEVVSEGKTGFIVPPADPGAMADAVSRFFDEGWGERMAANFSEEKRRFSWSSLADAIEGLYRSVCRRD